MATPTVLVLHSALGLRQAVSALADDIRALGLEVSAPDLFDGAVFDEVETAMQRLREHRDEATAAVDRAFEANDGPVIVVGFSWGAAQAQRLAEQHARVLGALLAGNGGRYHGRWDTGGRWRAGLPLALHHMIGDPWVDAEPISELVTEATRAGSDVSDYVYPGDGHLFMDPGLPDHDAACAELFHARVQGFLGRFA